MKSEMSRHDERFLRRAIELARVAREAGDQPFGSLLVGPTGDVLYEQVNTVVTERDITAHPELKLARWAAANLERAVARRTTMYTSCQPCSMCAGAIERAALGRIVYALSTAQLQSRRSPFAPAPPSRPIYDGPVLSEEARNLVDGCY
jgi:tRNA(Arg) A34 adenosine deaminase TadA